MNAKLFADVGCKFKIIFTMVNAETFPSIQRFGPFPGHSIALFSLVSALVKFRPDDGIQTFHHINNLIEPSSFTQHNTGCSDS